jgi:hypothetical protein
MPESGRRRRRPEEHVGMGCSARQQGREHEAAALYHLASLHGDAVLEHRTLRERVVLASLAARVDVVGELGC